MNDTISHSDLVAKLVKPGAKLKEEFAAEECNILHLLLALSGEVGELIDPIKKWIIYRQEFGEDKRTNVIEEFGDLEFYMEGLRQALGITREETLAANIKKLSKRYSSLSYSDKAAKDREDKKE